MTVVQRPPGKQPLAEGGYPVEKGSIPINIMHQEYNTILTEKSSKMIVGTVYCFFCLKM